MLKTLLLVLLLMHFPNAFAQGYPVKPIRFIVPNPPGGSTDLVARKLAAGLSIELNQSVVVDNRGGASGIVGAQIAMNSPADGYTLFLAPTSVMAINPALFQNSRPSSPGTALRHRHCHGSHCRTGLSGSAPG